MHRPPPGNRPLKTLERVLSKAGLGSRTDARKWIAAGRVRVNGKLIQTPDHWVDLERDAVTLDGKPIRARKKIYWLLYKPTGYLTTYKDPEGRPTVYDLIRDAGEWVVPVGRLDQDTSGLLLLTNDTRLVESVGNPEHKVPKNLYGKGVDAGQRSAAGAASRWCNADGWSDAAGGGAARARLREIFLL